MDFVETVRIIVKDQDKILLLEKSKNSHNPGALELPGGKVESDTKKQAALKELAEETSIAAVESELIELDATYEMTFMYHGKEVGRKIHFFLLDVSDQDMKVNIGQTVKEDGKSEDNHVGYRWLTISEYNELKSVPKDDSFIAQNSLVNIDHLI